MILEMSSIQAPSSKNFPKFVAINAIKRVGILVVPLNGTQTLQCLSKDISVISYPSGVCSNDVKHIGLAQKDVKIHFFGF